jgi:IS30 family transposase
MKHLTEKQRYTIEKLLSQHFTKSKIANFIGVHKSTISRELKRNSDLRSGRYISGLAQRKSEHRQKEKPRYKVFTAKIKERAEELLSQDFSPEQITGFCRKQGEEMVSHECLYQHIWSDKKKGGQLHTHLRRQGRRYRKRGVSKDSRGIIRNRVSIDQRPTIVEQKERFGDLEVDTIIGKNHKGAIVTINDRASGMLKMKRIDKKEASMTRNAIIELLEPWMPFNLSTMTADNGKEFAEHEPISEQLGIDFYFAHPYHSWERGANENINGLIRQYIPKNSDFQSLSDEYIKYIENKLNQRPRKRFGYLSPIQKMESLLFNNKVALET